MAYFKNPYLFLIYILNYSGVVRVAYSNPPGTILAVLPAFNTALTFF